MIVTNDNNDDDDYDMLVRSCLTSLLLVVGRFFFSLGH